jgi:hypothetical protein
VARKQSSIPTVVATVIRVAYIVVLLILFFAAYEIALKRLLASDRIITTLFVLWLVSAYVLLPRIHRWFSKLYVPNYYIGRVRTFDGLLGDPVNLAVLGTKKDLIAAMKQAGWTQAEELSLKSSIKMTIASVLKKSYPSAPVSSLFLFGNKQDLAFQIEVNGNPHKRHHVRFWKTPNGWWLPGGHKADWLGAATYDRRVGFSTLTLQITHKIAENVDEERDFVLATLKKANKHLTVQVVEHFTSGFHDKNGGGDRIKTDGALPFIDL